MVIINPAPLQVNDLNGLDKPGKERCVLYYSLIILKYLNKIEDHFLAIPQQASLCYSKEETWNRVIFLY